MIPKYKVVCCSSDSRYPQDLILTLRFDGDAPDSDGVICLVDDAPDLLEALERLAEDYHRKDGLGFDLLASTKMFAAIRKAKGESS